MNASLHNLRHSVDKPRLDSIQARSMVFLVLASSASSAKQSRTLPLATAPDGHEFILMARSLTIPSTSARH